MGPILALSLSLHTDLKETEETKVGLGLRRTVLSFDCRLVALISSIISRV